MKWSVQLPKIRQSFYLYLNSNILSHLNRVKLFPNFNRHQLIKHCTAKNLKIMFKKLSVQRNTEAPSKPTGYFFKKRRFSFRPHVNGVFVHHNADSLPSFLLCVDERKRRFFNMKMSYISHLLLALRMLC